MHISSPDLISAISAITGSAVVSLTSLSGGGNSKVMLMRGSDGRRFVIKRYAVYAQSTSERMQREIDAVRFLMRHRIPCITRLLGVDTQLHIAVFEYVTGKKLTPRSVTAADIAKFIGFMKRLFQLKQRADTSDVSPASEACFSLEERIKNIRDRYNRLLDVRHSEAIYRHLHEFLKKECIPTAEEVFTQARNRRAAAGIDTDSRLAPSFWTLSPLDFGIHNVLRRGSDLVFLDFEHFGLDDPAKLICDFLLHPRNIISPALKCRFVTGAIAVFAHDHDLPQRVSTIFPLCAVQWCLIVLNEFLPEAFVRRTFARGKGEQQMRMLALQLKKSRRLLKLAHQGNRYAYYETATAG